MSKFFTTVFAVATGLILAGQVQATESTTFTVTITNISTDQTLKLPDGKSVSVPMAPGVFAVGAHPNGLFSRGKLASEQLERLAEDGNFDPLLDQTKARKDLMDSGMFVPGQSFTITAKPGDQLDFAAMFVQSNDLFYGAKNGGIALFDKAGKPISGNVTRQVELYDAGTEVNQVPGAGPDQAPRQKQPNMGASEKVPVMPVAKRKDGFTYPVIPALVMMTIQPVSGQ